MQLDFVVDDRRDHTTLLALVVAHASKLSGVEVVPAQAEFQERGTLADLAVLVPTVGSAYWMLRTISEALANRGRQVVVSNDQSERLELPAADHVIELWIIGAWSEEG